MAKKKKLLPLVEAYIDEYTKALCLSLDQGASKDVTKEWNRTKAHLVLMREEMDTEELQSANEEVDKVLKEYGVSDTDGSERTQND